MKSSLLLLSILLASGPLLPAGEVHKASRKGDVAKVKALLQTDPKLIGSFENAGNLYTPLHVAAIAGHKSVVELLLASHAEINAGDVVGETPLHLATLNRRKEVVELLLQNKADVNARDKENRTPLFSALTRKKPGTKEVVELLLARKPDVNAKDILGQKPLDLAKQLDDPEIVALLKKHGAK